MYCFYLILLAISPSVLALPDLNDEDGWRLRENELYQRPTWRSRRTRVGGYPHYEESIVKDYLSQMMSGRVQATHAAMGLTGGDSGSDDELQQPLPRHRPQNKPALSPQLLIHQSERMPDYNRNSQFGILPSDTRFFEVQEKPTIPPVVIANGGFPVSVDMKMSNDARQTGDAIDEEPLDEYNQVFKTPLIDLDSTKENIILIALVVGSSIAAVSGIGLLIYGCIRLQRNAKAAADVEYPAYGVTGPNKEATPTGDRRLAHSAQMYHYQLTKQQIIAMESSTRGGERRGSISEADSDDENEEADYTVYECPGLAPTGEMEVKNPLFQDEPTPATTSQNGQHSETATDTEPKPPTINDNQ